MIEAKMRCFGLRVVVSITTGLLIIISVNYSWKSARNKMIGRMELSHTVDLFAEDKAKINALLEAGNKDLSRDSEILNILPGTNVIDVTSYALSGVDEEDTDSVELKEKSEIQINDHMYDTNLNESRIDDEGSYQASVLSFFGKYLPFWGTDDNYIYKDVNEDIYEYNYDKDNEDPKWISNKLASKLNDGEKNEENDPGNDLLNVFANSGENNSVIGNSDNDTEFNTALSADRNQTASPYKRFNITDLTPSNSLEYDNEQGSDQIIVSDEYRFSDHQNTKNFGQSVVTNILTNDESMSTNFLGNSDNLSNTKSNNYSTNLLNMNDTLINSFESYRDDLHNADNEPKKTSLPFNINGVDVPDYDDTDDESEKSPRLQSAENADRTSGDLVEKSLLDNLGPVELIRNDPVAQVNEANHGVWEYRSNVPLETKQGIEIDSFSNIHSKQHQQPLLFQTWQKSLLLPQNEQPVLPSKIVDNALDDSLKSPYRRKIIPMQHYLNHQDTDQTDKGLGPTIDKAAERAAVNEQTSLVSEKALGSGESLPPSSNPALRRLKNEIEILENSVLGNYDNDVVYAGDGTSDQVYINSNSINDKYGSDNNAGNMYADDNNREEEYDDMNNADEMYDTGIYAYNGNRGPVHDNYNNVDDDFQEDAYDNNANTDGTSRQSQKYTRTPDTAIYENPRPLSEKEFSLFKTTPYIVNPNDPSESENIRQLIYNNEELKNENILQLSSELFAKSDSGNEDETLPCPRVAELAKITYPVTALVTFPDAGTTWVRSVLEQLTGIKTDSIYNIMTQLKSGSVDSVYEMGKKVAIETHIATDRNFERAIVVIRNPFAVEVKHRTFRPLSVDWQQRVLWNHTYSSWLTSSLPLLVVTYEDLVESPLTELIKIADFLSAPGMKISYKCGMKVALDPPVMIYDVNEITGIYHDEKRRIGRNIDYVAEVARRTHPGIVQRLNNYKVMSGVLTSV